MGSFLFVDWLWKVLAYFSFPLMCKQNQPLWTKDKLTPGCLGNGVFLPATSREKKKYWESKAKSFCLSAPLAFILAVLQENPPVNRVCLTSLMHAEINLTKLDWSEVWQTQHREGLVGDTDVGNWIRPWALLSIHSETYILIYTAKKQKRKQNKIAFCTSQQWVNQHILSRWCFDTISSCRIWEKGPLKIVICDFSFSNR